MSIIIIGLFIVLLVRVTVSEDTLLVQKCCPQSQILSEEGHLCEDSGYKGSSQWGYRTKVAEIMSSVSGERAPWWFPDHHKVVFSNGTLLPQLHKYIESGVNLPCAVKFTTKISARMGVIMLNGSLVIPSANMSFSPRDYCADKIQGKQNYSEHIYLTCPCAGNSCFSSCCGFGEIVVEQYGKVYCMRKEYVTTSHDYWRDVYGYPRKWEWDFLVRWCYVDRISDTVTSGYHFGISARTNALFDRYFNSPFVIHEPDYRFGEELSKRTPQGGFYNNSQHPYWYFIATDDKVDTGNLKCILEKTENGPTEDIYTVLRCPSDSIARVSENMSVVLLYIGMTLLLLTALTFATVPESRNKNSTIVVCYLACLLMAELATTIYIQTAATSLHLCYFLLFTLNYFTWSSSFHMNVLCIDIARTFRNLKSPGRRHNETRTRKMWYMLYAWEFPLLMLIGMMVTVFYPSSPHSIYFMENSSIHHCYLGGPWNGWIYAHGPRIVISAVNVIVVLFTLMRICREMRIASPASSTRARRNFLCGRKFWVLFNLSCMVGPSRVIIIFINSMPGISIRSQMVISNVFNIVDLLNEASIFTFVCCRRKVLTSALQRLRFFRTVLCACRRKQIREECRDTSTQTTGTDCDVETQTAV